MHAVPRAAEVAWIVDLADHLARAVLVELDDRSASWRNRDRSSAGARADDEMRGACVMDRFSVQRGSIRRGEGQAARLCEDDGADRLDDTVPDRHRLIGVEHVHDDLVVVRHDLLLQMRRTRARDFRNDARRPFRRRPRPHLLRAHARSCQLTPASTTAMQRRRSQFPHRYTKVHLTRDGRRLLFVRLSGRWLEALKMVRSRRGRLTRVECVYQPAPERSAPYATESAAPLTLAPVVPAPGARF
jgi:hypothetical protein